jgi:hypothetical protein
MGLHLTFIEEPDGVNGPDEREESKPNLQQNSYLEHNDKKPVQLHFFSEHYFKH